MPPPTRLLTPTFHLLRPRCAQLPPRNFLRPTPHPSYNTHSTRLSSTLSAHLPTTTPPRSRLRIHALRTLFYTTLSLSAFALAAYPIYPILFPSPSPPTYTPLLPHHTSLNSFLLHNPLATRLRSDPAYTESRPHLKIPEVLRRNNFTAGVLAEKAMPVPQIAFIEKGEGRVYVFFYVGEGVSWPGEEGVMHGGLLATVLDEGMARCFFASKPGRVGMTANLKIEFLKDALLSSGQGSVGLAKEDADLSFGEEKGVVQEEKGRFMLLTAKPTKVEGRKVWVEGSICGLERDGTEGECYVKATALFVEPKQAKVSANFYNAARSEKE